MTNHLANSTSPYLLQHAGNPVDWYPWGTEALEKARREEKPVFLSIGYSACHWCHVMAHESFEDPATAALLNEHYVSIKVDREERPDLDGLYMTAVTALTGQGGWPLSVFLTPDLQPFYGGTYFPPEPRHGLPSFRELLLALSEAWRGQRQEVLRVGQQIADQLVHSAAPTAPTSGWSADRLDQARRTLVEAYDWQGGGWGAAPKFPQPMALEFLLRRALAGAPGTLEPVVHALQAMRRGGMYDVVGGGFARYSTDEVWHIPHFEKMLYDNAQLASVYLHAWQVTGRSEFRQVSEQTLDFVRRELTSPEGGFYSSLDADSPEGEGSFYAWTLDEIRAVLGEEAAFFELAYGIRARGNWEGRTILQRAVDDASLAGHFKLSAEAVVEKLTDCHARLLAARGKRPHPGTDDKVLTAWNGLTLAAFAEAAVVLENSEYLATAVRNAEFLLTALRPDGSLRRAWRAGRTAEAVFLEDYAALILGLLALYQADFQPRWFTAACELAEEMIARFRDPAGGFYDTPQGAQVPLARPKELQDNAVPSGNALAAEALLKLAAWSGRADWRELAERSLALTAEAAPRYPTAFGRWLAAADFSMAAVRQVAILGALDDPAAQALLAEVRKAYRPDLVLAAGPFPPPEGSPELLRERPLLGGQPTAYVCRGFVCRQPVTDPQALRLQLSKDPHD